MMTRWERMLRRVVGALQGAAWLALIVWWVVAFATRSDAADPPPETHPCREGLLEWLNKGDTTVCYGHLVPPETWAAAQAAVDENPSLRTRVRVLEEQVANLRAQVAETRAAGDAQLQVCQNTLSACELAKAPPKCSKPSLLGRPEFAYPAAALVGFFGGVAFDRGVGCP